MRLLRLKEKEDDLIAGFLLGVLSLSGVAILLYSTVWGVGLTPDSTVYIGAARNLLRGDGLVIPSFDARLMDSGDMVPLVGKQPLYPALLAMIGRFGVDPMVGARWLAALLFGANILTVGLVVYRWTRGSLGASLLGSLLTLTSADMLRVHQSAMTEPVFLFLALLGLALLASYLENNKPSRLIASSIAFASAIMARHIGVTLVATGVFGLLVLSRRRFLRRVTDAAALVVVSCLPVTLWYVRNLIAAGTSTGRRIDFHPVPLHELQRGLYTVSLWVIPKVFPWAYQAMAGAMVLAVIAGILGVEKVTAWGKQKSPPEEALPGQSQRGLSYLLAAFIFFYIGSVMSSISFLSLHTPLDWRILSPVFVAALVLVVVQAHRLIRSHQRRRMLQVLAVAASVALSGYYMKTFPYGVSKFHQEGSGYAAKYWATSELIQKVEALPPDTLIYTNGPDTIYIMTGRKVFCVPLKFNTMTRRANPDYASELSFMKKRLKNQRGVLVYFYWQRGRWYLPSEEELERSLPLVLRDSGAEGKIYAVQDGKS